MRRRRGSGSSLLVLVLVALGAFLLSFGRFSWTPSVGLAEPSETAPVVWRGADAQQPPTLRFRDVSDLPSPRVRAEAAILYNPATHEVLWDSNGLEPRPIASITKVMTALVLVDHQSDLSRDVVVSRRDVRRASTTYLRRGERISLNDLLHLALVASDNAAARAIARVSPWGTRGFVEQMNRKADDLGLERTTFVDPSGLDERNIASPYDLARLIAHASSDPTIAGIMRKSSYRLRTSRRRLTVRNTNRLLRGRHVVQGGKTGYIDEAGYCLAAMVKLPGSDPLAFVVLGARSNSARFAEVRRLVTWVSTKGRLLIVPGLHRAD